MSVKWISLNEAVGILGISISTLRRRIDDGQIESKLDKGRRLVQVSDESQIGSKSTFIEQLRSENLELQQQLQRFKEQIQQRDTEIEELKIQLSELKAELRRKDEQAEQARNQFNTIILQQTLQIEQAQQLAIYYQQPFWRRWKSKPKQLGEAGVNEGNDNKN